MPFTAYVLPFAIKINAPGTTPGAYRCAVCTRLVGVDIGRILNL
jgi:hypothetical protein